MRTICAVETCDRVVKGHGYCSRHYAKWRAYGDPLAARTVQFHGLPLRERFYRYVKKTATCWEWVGYTVHGYGRLNVEGRPEMAHRLAWRLERGEIPVGLFVLHKCDNPGCCNPEHLYLGTQAENMRDMTVRQRAHTTGPQGSAHFNAKLTEDDVRAIRAATGNLAALARHYGVSYITINKIRRGETWQHVELASTHVVGPAKGSRHYRTHLTEEDVRAIRQSAESRKVLAARYQVSRQTIDDILTFQTWQHVD